VCFPEAIASTLGAAPGSTATESEITPTKTARMVLTPLNVTAARRKRQVAPSWLHSKLCALGTRPPRPIYQHKLN
jgi:hypothetical protein